MELDLTRLNALAKEGKTALKQPLGDAVNKTEARTLTSPQKGVEAEIEGSAGIKKLQREADRRKDEIERTMEISQTYQANSKASSQLQTEILKGAAAGEDCYSLLLKACQAISLMTGNRLFYQQIFADILSIYGEGLGEEKPLQMQLAGAQERLRKLESALDRETTQDSKARIAKAIAAHRTLVAELERTLITAQ